MPFSDLPHDVLFLLLYQIALNPRHSFDMTFRWLATTNRTVYQVYTAHKEYLSTVLLHNLAGPYLETLRNEIHLPITPCAVLLSTHFTLGRLATFLTLSRRLRVRVLNQNAPECRSPVFPYQSVRAAYCYAANGAQVGTPLQLNRRLEYIQIDEFELKLFNVFLSQWSYELALSGPAMSVGKVRATLSKPGAWRTLGWFIGVEDGWIARFVDALESKGYGESMDIYESWRQWVREEGGRR